MTATIREKIQKRQSTNLELLKLLKKHIEDCPDLRWGQILVNFGFVPDGDPFYEESVDTLQRVNATRTNKEYNH